jgi:hypothetical protein
MDLDYLMHREQVERDHSRTASTPRSRALHGALADMFRDRIDFRRRLLRAGPGAELSPSYF